MRAHSVQLYHVAIIISYIYVAVVHAGSQPNGPSGTAFTYQGQLKQNGAPVTDLCVFEFTLWDDPIATQVANQVGPTLSFDGLSRKSPPIAVDNGLFQAVLDFGSRAFDGTARWLQIDVCCPFPCPPPYTTLGPRQPMTATPYALFALNGNGSGGDGHSLDAADGNPVDALFVNESGEVGIGTTSPLVPFHVVGNMVVDGDTLMTGIVGIGVLPEAQLHVLGNTKLVGDLTVNRVGIGTTPTDSLSVVGAVHVTHPSSELGVVRITRPTGTPGIIGVADNGHRRDIRFYDSGIALLTSSTNSIPSSINGIRIDEAGRVGIGTNTPPEALSVVGDIIGINNAGQITTELDGDNGVLRLRRADGSLGVLARATESTGSLLNLYDENGRARIQLNTDWGNSGNSRIVADEVQITGGSDLSEQFDITGDDAIEPGMVVSIDPDNPGKLMLSRSAHDRKVAGIISGANGIRTGMYMGQKGSEANGTLPVALTGRVYCYVDATLGSIQPGDMLTTSDTPGYAMKVRNHIKAQGAIIGKAMTALDEGHGLVLVLVNLQ